MGGPFDNFWTGIDFGRIKEISEVCGMSLKFNLDVRWQSQGVIYVVRPLNGSPVEMKDAGNSIVRFFRICL